jgi:hypothetical protein
MEPQMNRKHLSFIFMFASLFLIGWVIVACAGSTPPTLNSASSSPQAATTNIMTQPAPLTAVDWKNFTYTSSCYSDKPQQFVVRNGEGVVDGIHLQVYTPVYGDLTGDRQPEAAIPYSCSAADFAGVRVFVYTGNASKPLLLGDLGLMSPDSNNGGTVDTVTISNEIIQLVGKGYTPDAPHCCPDLHIKTSYRWNGSHFVIVSNDVTKL